MRSSRQFWLTTILTLGFVGVCLTVRAAIDRTPNGQVGAIYVASPSTLVSGDFDTLHTDVNHNLLTTATISGSVSVLATFTPVPSTVAPSPFTTTVSNGVTPVTLVAASAGKAVIVWSLTIDNEDTVTHVVDVITSSGASVWHFTLQASTDAIYDGAAAGFSMRSLTSQSLQFKIDASGTSNLVKAIGNTTYQ